MAAKWNVYGASVAGKGHIKNGMPCQDAHFYKRINKRWILAITSDGAGSHSNSHIGSQFVVKSLAKQLKHFIVGNKAFYKNTKTSKDDWKTVALSAFGAAATELHEFSVANSMDYKSLSCTVNMALLSKDLILTANVGDGRACYRNQQGEWKPMMIPFKGNEAGSTVFITTDWIWENDSYIGLQLIRDTASAFALISDGMEMHTYHCYVKDENGFFHDPNKPHDLFFSTTVETLKYLTEAGRSRVKINRTLAHYLETGKNVDKELDDKTLLIGFQID